MYKKLFLLISILYLHGCSVFIPYKNLPEPDGENIIGTDIFEIEDSSRDEWFTKEKDDKRKIIVQVWYPAIEPSDSIYPYIDNHQIRIPEIAKKMDIPKNFVKHIKNIRANAFFKAKPINKKFPVIIFSHGLGGTKIQNSINVESLASNGYIVYAIDHPFDAGITIFEDKTTALFDSYLPDGSSEKEFWETRLPQINTRSADISFLIDKIEYFIQSDYYLGKISDINKIGIFGHSFGGGTSIVASHNDPRISACLNLDGWLEPVPNYIINNGIDIPFYYIGQIQKNWDGALYNEQKLYDFHNNTKNSIIIEIDKTKHFDYTDTPYFNRVTRILGVSGKSGKNITLDLNHTINDFFDYYLKNKDQFKYDDFISKYETEVLNK